VAYPRIGTLPAGVRAALRAASVSRDAAQRDEFDDLRVPLGEGVAVSVVTG